MTSASKVVGLVNASVLCLLMASCKPRTFNQGKAASEDLTTSPAGAEAGVECVPKGKHATAWNGALPLIRDRSIYFTNHAGGANIAEKTSKGLPVTSNAMNANLWQQETFVVTKVRCAAPLGEAFLGPLYVRSRAYTLGENRYVVLLAAHGAPPVGQPVVSWTEARRTEWSTTVKGLTGATRGVVATATLNPAGVLLLEALHDAGDAPVVFKRYMKTDWVEASGIPDVANRLAASGIDADKVVADALKGNSVDLGEAIKASLASARAGAGTSPEGTLTFSDPRKKRFHDKAFEFVLAHAPEPGTVGASSQSNTLYFHRAASLDKTREGAVFTGKNVWLVSTQRLNVNGGGTLYVLSEAYNVDGTSRPAYVDLTGGTDEAPGGFEVELYPVVGATFDDAWRLTVGAVDTTRRVRLSVPGGGARSVVSAYTQPVLVER